LAVGVSNVFKQIRQLALKQPAKSVDCLEIYPSRSLVVQKSNGVSMKPCLAGNIDDFHFSLAHEARKVAADHKNLNKKSCKTTNSY
jgi:hypothetical protein